MTPPRAAPNRVLMPMPGAGCASARFYELLAIDSAKESIVGLFWYGVPKVIPTQTRRPVEEIVTKLA
jgi:hypothetical protein